METQRDPWKPTPQREWVAKGDRCVSPAGMAGEVLNVSTPRAQGLLPTATVKWSNGYTGRLTITNLRRA